MSLCPTYSMLDPKPTVYKVSVEDESNNCVAQFMQLSNINQITFQKNSVSVLPTQQVGRGRGGESVINLLTMHKLCDAT